MTRPVDYNPKPIDDAFFEKPNEYPVTGTHNGHEVRAEGIQRYDKDGKPYPTKNGIHGTNVAVDWETCTADGACMDVCPVNVYEWALNPGQKGSGNDKVLEQDPNSGKNTGLIKLIPLGNQIAFSAMLV